MGSSHVSLKLKIVSAASLKLKKLQNKWKSVEDTVCSQSALVCCEFIDLILHLEKMFLLSAFIIYVFINCIMRI